MFWSYIVSYSIFKIYMTTKTKQVSLGQLMPTNSIFLVFNSTPIQDSIQSHPFLYFHIEKILQDNPQVLFDQQSQKKNVHTCIDRTKKSGNQEVRTETYENGMGRNHVQNISYLLSNNETEHLLAKSTIPLSQTILICDENCLIAMNNFRKNIRRLLYQKKMYEKKSTCKYDDYIEPKTMAPYNASPLSKSLAEFKLDRIFPRNINIKLNLESKQNPANQQGGYNGKNSHFFKMGNCPDNKFYNQYLTLKDKHLKNSLRRNKIAQIFNIRSINLVEKAKLEPQKPEVEAKNAKQKYTSKDLKRPQEKEEKDSLKGLNLMIGDKKRNSPESIPHRNFTEKRSNTSFKKLIENKSLNLQKNGDAFEVKLNQYIQYIRQNCQNHGLPFKQIENYTKNSITFTVGRGNNGHLIKETLKKRWWWSINEQKHKKDINFIWTQLKEKNYYLPKEKRSISTLSESIPLKSQSPKNRDSFSKEHMKMSQELLELSQIQVHNHFQNNEYLGNKKALYYNMKAFYERQNKNVFDYLPVTFHVKRYGDEAWKDFSNYYFQDQSLHNGEKRLWIVKPGENSNRGNGITIYSDYNKIRQWVQSQISENNNLKKTFIIQKYIDKPLLYNKRKFDIRCYMLLVRLNGSIKGYWYNEGYIRTSCYQFQLDDTSNQFIHLTNDAIQVNSEKYGKYEDGNKLSYHNFDKYLEHNHKTTYRLADDICPQLKQIATDSIEATYHLLGEWNGLPTFEIFGLDFMIDQKFKPWLIEINTNPCLETSSSTLERIIPRMVDNAFKLSVDLLFPPPLNWQNSKKHYLPNKASNNLFELVFNEFEKGKISGMMSDQIIIEMGEVEEDNQVYQQKGEKEAHAKEATETMHESNNL